MTLEDVDAFINLMNSYCGELNENALASITGGVSARRILHTSRKDIKESLRLVGILASGSPVTMAFNDIESDTIAGIYAAT